MDEPVHVADWVENSRPDTHTLEEWMRLSIEDRKKKALDAGLNSTATDKD